MIPPSYRALLDAMSETQIQAEQREYEKAFRATWPYRDRVIARAILPVHIARLRHLREYRATKTLTSR